MFGLRESLVLIIFPHDILSNILVHLALEIEILVILIVTSLSLQPLSLSSACLCPLSASLYLSVCLLLLIYLSVSFSSLSLFFSSVLSPPSLLFSISFLIFFFSLYLSLRFYASPLNNPRKI